jgi:ACR3 family arsenite efflux pump ArsB
MSEAGGAGAEARQGPVGLGGWLILPMLGLLITPLAGMVLIATYPDMSDVWQYLTLGQSAFVIAEIAMNAVVLLVAPIALLAFMFKRWEIFPGWYMIWAAAVPIMHFADALMSYAVFPEAYTDGTTAVFDKETTRGILRSIFSAAIWIPYMMRSERVANTFVR